MMAAYIQTIRVAPLVTARTIVADSRDTGLSGQAISTCNAVVVYDRSTGQQDQIPVAVVDSGNYQTTDAVGTYKDLLEIVVGGVDAGAEKSQWSIATLLTPTSDFQLQSGLSSSNPVDAKDGTVTFCVSLQNVKGGPKGIPLCLWSTVTWTMSTGSVPQNLSAVPMEVYILPNLPLPKYLDKNGVPLLLLRLFVKASTNAPTKDLSKSDWVARVVKLCHGTCNPTTGEDSDTTSHWLKYDSDGGACAFVTAAPGQMLPYYNYGGLFRLNAWLDAYRNFRTYKVATLVNCYDQAGAVDVALSLGIDFNNVAWEYHQPYGFIGNSSSLGDDDSITDAFVQQQPQLVGWGHCNSPYFVRDTTKIITKPRDVNRSSFKNHAFLSWSPDFHPDLFIRPDPAANISNFFDMNQSSALAAFQNMPTSPTDLTKPSTLLAIDACAGPHLGNELLGTYVPPKEQTSNDTTYWGQRDFIWNPNTTKGDFTKYTAYNYWTSGVTGTADVDKYHLSLPNSPFDEKSKLEPTDFAAPAGSSLASMAFGGKVSEIQQAFANQVTSTAAGGQPVTVPIKDIPNEDSSVIRETKMYSQAKGPPYVEYWSLRVTVAPNQDTALHYMYGRAKIIGDLGDDTATSFTSTETTGAQTGKMLVSYASILFVFANLMVEVTGLIPNGGPTISNLAQTVETFLATRDNDLVGLGSWQNSLN